MTSKSSVKLSEENKTFLNKLGKNRIKTDTDEKMLSYSDLIEVIGKYFRLNNDRYLELAKLESDKNV